MDKIQDAKLFLKDIGLPEAQQSDLCAYTILALSNIKKKTNWIDATNEWYRIHDIIEYIRNNYNIDYAENSRETFRKTALHHFRIAALVEDNGKATNSPNYRYRITDEALSVIRSIDTDDYGKSIMEFLRIHNMLADIYAEKRSINKIPVKINDKYFKLSNGSHNMLQKAIIEEFGPRFAPGAECLYLGDTTEKTLVNNNDKLLSLGFSISVHDKMPDVVLYSEKNNWIYFVEAVTSVGPMSAKRLIELNALTENVKAGKIFVTAFPDFKTYKRFADKLSWDTEVWIAEMPDHMIHLNGDRFLGPR